MDETTMYKAVQAARKILARGHPLGTASKAAGLLYDVPANVIAGAALRAETECRLARARLLGEAGEAGERRTKELGG